MFYWSKYYYADDFYYTAADDLIGTKYSANKRMHHTLIFHAFMVMTIFNTFNCRMLGPAERNIFSQIFWDIQFLVVIVVEFILQYTIVTYGGLFAGCEPLKADMYTLCICLGFLQWVWAYLVKLTPATWVDPFYIHIDESKKATDDDVLLRAFRSVTQTSKKEEKKDPLLDKASKVAP